MASGGVLALANSLAGLIAYPIYLYCLGPKTYGLWVLLSVVLTFSQFGMLGIPEALTKLVAEKSNDKDPSSINKCASTSLFILFCCGTIISTGIYLFANPIAKLFSADLFHTSIAIQYLPIIALLSFYIFLVTAINAILSGLGRMDQANYILSVGRILVPAVSIPLLLMEFGLKSLMIGNIASYILIHFLSVVYIRRIRKIEYLRLNNIDKDWLGRIIHFGGAVSAMTLVNLLLIPLNKIFLSRYAGLESVSVYEICYRLSMQLRNLFQVVFKAFLPEISKESAKLDSRALNRIRALNLRSIVLISKFALPVYLFLFLAASFLLEHWLRGNFISTMPDILRILLVATFLSLLCVPSYYTLLGMGFVKLCFFSYALQSSTNIAIIMGVIASGASLSLYTISYATLAGMATCSIFLFLMTRIVLKNREAEVEKIIV